MRSRPLGDSGLVVSVVGLGGNNFGRRIDGEATTAVVDAALECGITLIDTADIYGDRGGSETLLGEALRGRRDQVVLATKFGMDMGGSNGPDWGARGSRRYVRRAVEASLTRLQTDWIDLYQYHAPDGVTPLEETVAALDELVREGKVRYTGSSNLAAWQVADADSYARAHAMSRFVSAQNAYSLLDRTAERELAPRASPTASASSPTSPWRTACSPGSTGAGRRRPPAPGWRIASTRCATARTTASRPTRRSRASAGSRCSTWRSAGWPRNRPSAR